MNDNEYFGNNFHDDDLGDAIKESSWSLKIEEGRRRLRAGGGIKKVFHKKPRKNDTRDEFPQNGSEGTNIIGYDINRGDYSKIEENMERLPEEIQEVLKFVFCKSEKTREDLYFFYKIKKVLDELGEIKQRLRYYFYKIVDRNKGQEPENPEEIPIQCFSFKGELDDIKKERKTYLPQLSILSGEEVKKSATIVFKNQVAEFSEKVEEVENS